MKATAHGGSGALWPVLQLWEVLLGLRRGHLLLGSHRCPRVCCTSRSLTADLGAEQAEKCCCLGLTSSFRAVVALPM